VKAWAAVVLLSCSSAEAREIRFDTLEYTLAAGEEKYFCYTMKLPSDRETVVTAFTPHYGKLVHHFVLSYTLTPEPAGFSECPVRFKDSWVPLYEAGRESGKLTVPSGTAFRFSGQQLVMQLHLVNPGRAAVTEKSGVTMETIDPTQKTVSAGIFGFDNRAIAIAPRSDAHAEMSCTMTRDMDVFAVLGHMHERGTSIELKRGTDVLFTTPWSFDVQPTTPLRFHVSKGDVMSLRCAWNNSTDNAIAYGERAADEMCSLIWYYTPYEKLDGCAKP
jgi:hypothetical protein